MIVYDHYPPPTGKKRGKYKGFRLNLGLMKNPHQALARLQDFVRFVMIHRKSRCLEQEVVKELHREGIDGMITILREVSEASIELIWRFLACEFVRRSEGLYGGLIDG